METHDEQRKCIDEQTKISSLSIELCCKKMAANYKKTEEQLNVLLKDSKAKVFPTLGGVILINTTNEKQLAKVIVEEIKHYFGEPKNKPKNTADEALIISRSNDWLQGINSDTSQTRGQYVDFVVERTRHDYSTGTHFETTSSFEEIIKAVEAWADKKRDQPAPAQPLNDEQSHPAQPDIMTDRAKKHFAKAIQAGFMEQTGNGYKWTFLDGERGAKAALGYFIKTVYDPNVVSSNQIPFKALGELFGVKRLDSTIYALSGRKRPPRWQGKIDSLFND